MCKGTVAAPYPCDVSIPDFGQKLISFLVKNMLITERKFFVIRSQRDFRQKSRRGLGIHLRDFIMLYASSTALRLDFSCESSLTVIFLLALINENSKL